MQLRNILVLTAALFVAAISPLAAQQAQDSALAKPAIPPVSTVRHAPAPAPVGPRASAQFQRITPTLAPSASARSSDVMDDDGQHTIVVSTLALVLAVIIIVLVVVN